MSYIVLELNNTYTGKTLQQLRDYLHGCDRIRVRENHGIRLSENRALLHVWGNPDERAQNYISGMGKIVRIDQDTVTQN